MMTTKQLYEIIQTQQKEIDKLTVNFKALKEWSDLNDFWLREMIDALTESVEKNHDLIYEFHNEDKKMGENLN